eukprot:XP_001694598.1 mitochondrial substrate carrier [Chlamydomonas reinhardtii]
MVAPLERIKILLQVQHMAAAERAAARYTGVRDVLARLPAREGGVLSLWRGNGANVARLFPDVAFRFAVHDQFRVMFAPLDGSPPGVAEKLAAGAATGVLKTALFYPLDLCRTRITADHGGGFRSRIHEGVRGLYRGCLLSMGGVAPYLAISCYRFSPFMDNPPPNPATPCSRSFTMYDELRRRLPADRESVSAWWYPLLKMGCGAAAAVSAQTVVYPLDTVRRCMQMNGAAGQAVRYRSAYDCLRQLLRSPGGGLAALYRGCAANCLKTSIGAPIHFIMYDAIKAGIQAVDPTTGVSSPL